MQEDLFIENSITKSIDVAYIEIKKNSVKIFKLYTYRSIDFYIDYDFSKEQILDIIASNNYDLIVKNIERIKNETIEDFDAIYNKTFNILKIYASNSNIEDSEIYLFLNKNLKSLSYNKLIIKEKLQKDIELKFLKFIEVKVVEKRKKELLSTTIRDFKLLYPKARKLNREIIFHIGGTNSGKTYEAMQELINADTGYYLAPLRLLAFQGYKELMDAGINVSLITGEEEKINHEAGHISSTIEMLNYDTYVDVAVIDEIQMIDDRDRGWAWIGALIGVNAKKIYLTGSYEAYYAVKNIVKYLGEKLIIKEYKRKGEIRFLDHHMPLTKLKKSSALITFSRKEVIDLKIKLGNKFKISIIYGNLSPEVRSKEAENFKNGTTDILIATDAIAMGLNLPIETVVFYRDSKFDGKDIRELTSSEVKQIAGRAGRYGLHEVGYITAINKKILNNVKRLYNEKIEYIKPPYYVMMSLNNVNLIANILNSNKLEEVSRFFYDNMDYLGDFKISHRVNDIIYISKIIDKFNFDLTTKYNLSLSPLQMNSPLVMESFTKYLDLLEKDREINFEKIKIKKDNYTLDDLLLVEDKIKELSLYLWLSFKFNNFKYVKEAREYKDILNEYMQKLFKFEKFTKRCKRCNKRMSLTYKFSICERCHNKK